MINSKKKRFTNVKGFTIVELVIVIAVIAILSAVLIPTFSNLVKKANESSDIQAVRNMNVYLAQAEATEGVNSILDVYDIFDESNYVVENYKPLYKGRYFYYDKQKKQILYVDEGGQVLFPADSKGTQQGTNDWFSLSMEIATKKVELIDNTYAVSSPEEYAYVVEQLNKGFSGCVIIEINKDLDFRGADISINVVETGATLTIDGNGNTIENITSVDYTTIGNGNADKKTAKYHIAGLVAENKGTLIISDLNVANVNVKNEEAGNAGALIGYSTSNISLTNVSVSNSEIIGNRNVGTLAGNKEGAVATLTDVTISNVEIKTVLGRSGKIFGVCKNNQDVNGVTINNCNVSLYEQSNLFKEKSQLNEGSCEYKITGYKTYENKTNNDTHSYGFSADALYFKDDYECKK